MSLDALPGPRSRAPFPPGSGLQVLNTEKPEGSNCKGGAIATYAIITVLILAVIGGLVAMGLTGQFTSDGWLCKVAFPAIKEVFEHFGQWVVNTAIPAIREFLNMKANLTIGQGLLYIALPIGGALLLGALGSKYGPPALEHLKNKWEEHRSYKADSARIKEDMNHYEALLEQEKATHQVLGTLDAAPEDLLNQLS